MTEPQAVLLRKQQQQNVYNNNNKSMKKMYLMRELAEHISNEDTVDIHSVLVLCPMRTLATLTQRQSYTITNIHQDFLV